MDLYTHYWYKAEQVSAPTAEAPVTRTFPKCTVGIWRRKAFQGGEEEGCRMIQPHLKCFIYVNGLLLVFKTDKNE